MELTVIAVPISGSAVYGQHLRVRAGGRNQRGSEFDFDLGAGWYEPEHRFHGMPFPPIKQRFDRLEESLAVITGL